MERAEPKRGLARRAGRRHGREQPFGVRVASAIDVGLGSQGRRRRVRGGAQKSLQGGDVPAVQGLPGLIHRGAGLEIGRAHV